MTTKALLNRLVPKISGGWSRSTGDLSVLKLIEQAQDALLKEIGSKRVFRGTDNKGFPPYLLTTAGNYQYEITGAYLSCGTPTKTIGGTSYSLTADIVTRVFIDITNSSDYGGVAWCGEPAVYWAFNPFSSATERLEIALIAVDSSPALEATNPTVTFKTDPGTTTTKFFCEFLWRAPRLVSENIPLIIPQEFESAIEDYVIGTIQGDENGGISDRLTNFWVFWVPKFAEEYNRGAKAKTTKIKARIC
jgi:hypothetical protein